MIFNNDGDDNVGNDGGGGTQKKCYQADFDYYFNKKLRMLLCQQINQEEFVIQIRGQIIYIWL